jgi:transposase
MTSDTVGADISKATFDAAHLNAAGKYKHKKFANTPEGFAAFLAWLLALGCGRPLVCMEATGAYGIPLADFLAAQGWPASVVNPAKIHAFAGSELSRAKTDKAFRQAHRPLRAGEAARPVDAPAARHPRTANPAAPRRRPAGMRQMEQNRLDTADPAVAGSIRAVLALLGQELEATRERIRRHIDDRPDLKRRRDLLESIPGVGAASAAHLLVALSEHYGFANAKQAAAHAGLAPRLKESGQWKGKTRLSKTGDPLLRKALYLPAVVAWQHNPAVRAFCERLKANGKSGKAVACAAMRKLLHIAFAILKSGKPFDPNLGLA